jgi:S1-C subfamily serine protease
VATDFGSSDQKSFLDAGVPAVQFFTGPHLDYHRPTDTVDKIDSAGLVNVAKVAQEAIEYLTGRLDPLTSTLTSTCRDSSTPAQPPGSHRTVSLGTIPDFTYQKTGVRITGTTPGSPAEKAGLQAEDVIVQLGETAIDDLRALSKALAALQPGETISITFTRNGRQHTTQTTVVAR